MPQIAELNVVPLKLSGLGLEALLSLGHLYKEKKVDSHKLPSKWQML